LLVVGSEAHGIPEAWLDTCDALMTLPMPGNTESLNAAVAGSIALYVACQEKA
jgi:tRNA G18 (ribose-2'-O)-methylase SpoU